MVSRAGQRVTGSLGIYPTFFFPKKTEIPKIRTGMMEIGMMEIGMTNNFRIMNLTRNNELQPTTKALEHMEIT